MDTFGAAALPYPLPSEEPDGPGAFLALIQRLSATMDPVATVGALPSSGTWQGMRMTVTATPGAYWEFDGGWKMRGVAEFASAAARTAAIPAPQAGMRSKLATKLYDEVYWGAPIAAWRPYGGSLLPIAPSSSPGNTVSPAGEVSFSVATSVILNGIFSADFDAYEVNIDINAGAPSVEVQLRAGAVTATAAQYDRQQQYGFGAGTAGSQALGAASWLVSGLTAGTQPAIDMTLVNPFLVAPTKGRAESAWSGNPMNASNAAIQQMGLHHRLSTSYDGIVITFSGGTSGNVRVNGRNNNR